ncbi:MAG TPA: bifunctional hydroxymethylpyrimidine kinase/phosphomethylpyrimidine kinase [Dehalococcoidia bacterium]|nr:bifunctional hydroxymethylpyrimidine kinase/phosphomethylpyrimidine kinase [Dehalococcoidia bacterium]
MPRALTIAGSDSGGGAGIQADLKTFAALGVYGATALTAVTAQNTREVAAVATIPADLVARQIRVVLDDIGASAIKTGMLGDAGIVHAVAGELRAPAVASVVVDPVITSSSGTALLDDAGVDAMVRELLPLAQIVTPNIEEAKLLAGREIASWDDARAAAAVIVEQGARSVVITGGDFGHPEAATDLYYDGQHFREYTAVRVRTQSTHGTGCTFSAAITAGLARGMDTQAAIALAKSYVSLALEHAYPIGSGHGPVHHFYRYWQPVGERYRPGMKPR